MCLKTKYEVYRYGKPVKDDLTKTMDVKKSEQYKQTEK